jgi:uncharacterized protein YfeS
MATPNKLIISIEDIDLEIAEVKYYKRSQQIAEFNYDENLKVLHKICRIRITEQDIDNILYVTSLIELLGLKYISFAKTLHDQNFMILNNDMIETIGKYIDWQSYTASAYTIVMRTACKIINEKYYAYAVKA